MLIINLENGPQSTCVGQVNIISRLYYSKYQDLQTMGSRENLSKEEENACMKFIGKMYGKENCTSLNALRAYKAGHKVSTKRLPPTNDSFHQHVLRNVY
jgi:hypothetical protein